MRINRNYRRVVVLSLTTFSVTLLGSVGTANGQDCVSQACINVYIHDGQIVIEGRKDAPKPVVRSRTRATRTTSPFVTPTPQSTVSPSPSSSTTKRTRSIKRIIRKSIIPRVVTKIATAVSLNDKLVKILPVANISKQPEAGALVGVPVIYWCDLPAAFASKVGIVGEIIDVTMRPAFFWSFGDGAVLLTTDSGAPYPSNEVAHTYSRPGLYPVVLVSIWNGTWIHNGVARAITGEIRKTSIAFVRVEPAPTLFKK